MICMVFGLQNVRSDGNEKMLTVRGGLREILCREP